MPLPFIPADKANHFAYGAAIGATSAMVAGPVVGLAAAAIFGAAKEAIDAWRNHRARQAGLQAPHGVEFADALWTAAGGLAATAAALVG